MSKRYTNFYVRSLLFSSFSILGAAFNYFLYPSLSRVVEVGDFGDFTTMMAISNQLLSILLAFNVISIYIVKYFKSGDALVFAQALQRSLFWLLGFSILTLLLVAPSLGVILKIDNPVYFVILAAILLSSVPSSLWTGYLQGHKKMIHIGLYAAVSALSKLILATILAKLFGITGGLLGVLLGSILGLLLLGIISPIKLPSIRSTLARFSDAELAFLRKNFFYIIECLLVIGLLSILQNIDIAYAKFLFNPETAGAYTGISILGNALFYVLMLLVWILLPEIEPTNHTHNKRLLKNAYTLIGGISLVSVVLIYFMKEFIVVVLLGDNFKIFKDLLTLTASFQLTLISVTLYAYYLLILRKRRAFILVLSISVPCLLSPLLVAKSPYELIWCLLLSIYLGLVVYIGTLSLVGLARRLSRQDKGVY